MTRNTITKAKIIIAYEKTRQMPITGKIDSALASKGDEYSIHCKYGNSCAYRPIIVGGKEEGRFTYSDDHIRFSSYKEAKEYVRQHLESIKAAVAEAYADDYTCDHSKKYRFRLRDVKIEGHYTVFEDVASGKKVYSEERAKKLYKNYIIARTERSSGEVALFESFLPINCFVTTATPDYLLFEYFKLVIDHNKDTGKDQLKLIAGKYKDKTQHSFKYYKNGSTFLCEYNEKYHRYDDIRELFQEDCCWGRGYYSYDENAGFGFGEAQDLTERQINIESCRRGDFSNTTMNILSDFGISKYIAQSDWNSDFGILNDMGDFGDSIVKRRQPYSENETQICKDITDFLKDVPYDEEHLVVKFKNGYIIRFGAINQAYQITDTDYRGGPRTYIRNEPRKGSDVTSCVLVHEQCQEFARLFISNSFNTRSLSISSNGGRTWRHDGIHLVSNLFRANPKESKLNIDMEARNRKALETLYTVHPKLKYMKKYMEQHPDVLYNSCIPFLRALFQYNMILETFIALKKDSIFWTPVNNPSQSRYYGWHCRSDSYKGQKETFDIENFVNKLCLRKIPQKGDFYQRLGLTKPQFKLIFEDLDNWENIASAVFQIKFKIPGSVTYCKHDSWGDYYPAFKTISFEDFRMAVEIIKSMLAESSYSIHNKVNSISEFLGYNMQKVYKALVVKKYDPTLFEDYLRMRKNLEDAHFVDFKPSIWDIFPDDNDDLQRYHDRIMFLNSEYSFAKELYEYLRPVKNPVTQTRYTINEVYLHCKEHSISCNDFHNLLGAIREIVRYSNEIESMGNYITALPASAEEYQQLKAKVNSDFNLYSNLYSIYWGEGHFCSYHSSNEENRAKNQWGMIYREFVVRQRATSLNKDRWDLYLRLRQRFSDNMDNFQINNYPVWPHTDEELSKLYNELATQEPELNQLIAEKERERRNRIMRENESKVERQQRKYVERYQKLKSLNYKKKDDDLCIVVPENLVSLIVEGQTLHHCVGSFVDSVSEGKDTIVFLRKQNDVETPYITINLQQSGKNWYIDQAHGDRNSDISAEDVTFLKKWATDKGIILDSVTQHYGAKCHH